MTLLFIPFGVVFIVMGIMGIRNPNSLMPKITKKTGEKSEDFQIEYNPTITKLLSLAAVIFGIIFILTSLYLAFV